MRGAMPDSVSTRIGEMAIEGTEKMAMLMPRDSREATGDRTNSMPARTAMALPMRKPADAPHSVATTCSG